MMSLYLSACLKNPVSYQLNDSRIEIILKAKTLDEATRMGLWDRIKDYFRNGTKEESIRKLYEQVTSPDNNYDAQPLRIADRFSRLRSLAKEEYQPEFCIEVKESPDDAWQWDYRLQIGKQVIFQSEVLDKSSSNNFDEISVLAKCIECANEYITYKKEGNMSLEDHIQSRIECMSDDKSVQKNLQQCLDDTRFSGTEFIKIQPHEDESKFIAHFKKDKLVLSNRKTENNEYRGEFLQNILKNSDFTNLRTLLSKDHGTEKDNLLCYIATPFKLELINMLGDEASFSSEKIRAVAYSQKVANTTVGALWKLAAPASGNADMDTLSIDSGRGSSIVSIDNPEEKPVDLLNELKNKSAEITARSKRRREENQTKGEHFFNDFHKRDATLTLIRITGLMTDKPNAGFLLKYLNNFIKQTDISWSSANKNNQERLFDQEARRDFNRGALVSQLLNTQSAVDKVQMLENMEGKFGQRLRGVVEFAAEKVGQNEEDPVLISTAYKYSTLMEDLIVTLRNQSGKEEVVVGKREDIRQLGELTESEIQALSMVGIKQTVLE